MKKTIFISSILFALAVLMLPAAESAVEKGSMTLLAVKESGDIMEGSTAELFLEIKKGSGRVFMETFPLSKMDTQISTRFAKEIACDYLDRDCERYDFFYTLRSDSPIIGGPSAGAAIAVLTAAMLEEETIDENTAITGTINSGGLVGPVGGLKEKIDAANGEGIKKVLIPLGGRFAEKKNLTLDLKDYAEEKHGIEVIETVDLTDALYQFTGKKFKEEPGKLKIDKNYAENMRLLADMLCNRTEKLQKNTGEMRIDKERIDKDYLEKDEKALNLSEKAKKAFEKKDYYSAASYCFGANVRYRSLFLEKYDVKNISRMQEDIRDFDEEIGDKKIKTISDLETYMIVKERLREALAFMNNTGNNSDNIAYAIERAYSAETWSRFFDFKGKEFDFDREALRGSCIEKISEAEERVQYVSLFFPGNTRQTKKEIEYAYEDLGKGDYELCLFRASKAKAEVDVVIGVIGVKEENVEEVLNAKINAVKEIIAEQQGKGIFPILGYSYYEYARSLKEDDIYSALLYSEYALELSKLDMYFKEKKILKMPEIGNDLFIILGIIGGFLIGFGLGKTEKIYFTEDKKTDSKKRSTKKKTPKKTSKKASGRKKSSKRR